MLDTTGIVRTLFFKDFRERVGVVLSYWVNTSKSDEQGGSKIAKKVPEIGLNALLNYKAV